MALHLTPLEKVLKFFSVICPHNVDWLPFLGFLGFVPLIVLLLVVLACILRRKSPLPFDNGPVFFSEIELETRSAFSPGDSELISVLCVFYFVLEK